MNITKISKPALAKYTTKYNTSSSMVKPVILASLLAFGLFAQSAQAALTFSFNYLNPGQGFDDPTLGADRKAALNNAAESLGLYFASYNANLTYDVTSSSVNSSTLASAGSDSVVSPGTFQNTFVQTKILNNGATDGNGAGADGNIDWNFFESWGLADNVAANEYDFKSVAMHELLHTFGFTSFTGNGGKGLESQPPGTADTWATFDNFLTDAAGNRLISSGGAFDSSKVAALTGGGSVFFNGPNATAANGGAGVPIYSPITWQDGSSIAHLDDDNPLTSQLIMASSVDTGPGSRTLSAIEIGILKDIGYTNIAAPIPVPAALWFMASGLLAVFGANRQRKPA